MNARRLLCSLALVFLCASAGRAADNVLITEFMAANDGVLRDEDGDAEDWIEIHNAGTNTVNLLGWMGLTIVGTLVTLWPTMLRTRTVSESPGTPGRSMHEPRTIKSIGTPACEAR